MHTAAILALADKHSNSALDALPHLTGMMVVMVTLAILWGICALTARLVRQSRHEQTPAPQTAAPPTPVPIMQPQPTPEAPLRTAPEIVAVIAAAVAATVGKSYRVISIKPMCTSWERAGRQSVLTSHRIR